MTTFENMRARTPDEARFLADREAQRIKSAEQDRLVAILLGRVKPRVRTPKTEDRKTP